jgi:hypothetical protein
MSVIPGWSGFAAHGEGDPRQARRPWVPFPAFQAAGNDTEKRSNLMTHTPKDNPAAAHPRADAQAIADFRWLADDIGLPGVCEQDECRRRKRCRGPVRVPEFLGGAPLPACWAQAMDDMYEPVVRWNQMKKNINDIVSRQAKGPAPG